MGNTLYSNEEDMFLLNIQLNKRDFPQKIESMDFIYPIERDYPLSCSSMAETAAVDCSMPSEAAIAGMELNQMEMEVGEHVYEWTIQG